MAQNKDNALLVLDVDGVLIDADRSYREAVRKALGELVPHLAWEDEHFTAFKRVGGFNNDFRLAAAATLLAKQQDASAMLLFLAQSEGQGLPELEKAIDELEPACKEVVQKHYEVTRHLEKPLVTLEALQSTRRILTVLTGRPPEEWLMAIDVLGFSLPAITESEPHWRKPSPDGLLHWAEEFQAKDIIFAGDTLDDAQCLQRARQQAPDRHWTFAAIGPERARIMAPGDFSAPHLTDLLGRLNA